MPSPPPEPPAAGPAARLVAACRHETGDGAHVDLFVDGGAAPCPAANGPDDDVRDVATLRLDRRPDALAPGERASATPIDAHRRFYLRLAHVHRLDRGRGVVTPLRRGELRIGADADTPSPDFPITADDLVGRTLSVRWAGDDEPSCYRLDRADDALVLLRLP